MQLNVEHDHIEVVPTVFFHSWLTNQRFSFLSLRLSWLWPLQQQIPNFSKFNFSSTVLLTVSNWIDPLFECWSWIPMYFDWFCKSSHFPPSRLAAALFNNPWLHFNNLVAFSANYIVLTRLLDLFESIGYNCECEIIRLQFEIISAIKRMKLYKKN